MKATALLALLVVAGCDSGPDISGFYQTTMLSVDSAGCGPGTPELNPPMYFFVKTEKLTGFSFYSLKSCTQPNEEACTGSIGNAIPLSQSISDGYSGRFSVSSGSTASCSLTFGRATGTLKDGIFRYESIQFGDVNQMVADCDPDEASKRGTSMPCKGYTLLVGAPYRISTQ